MRLVLYFLILQFFIGCQFGTTKNNYSVTVIQDYIDLNIIQKNYDIRIYNPPPPPELKDSINYGGSIKNDSIINELEPLRIFINDSIKFSQNLVYENIDSVKEFLHLKKIIKDKRQSVFLNINNLKKRKGIIIENIYINDFFKLYPTIRLENNYGGLLSFENLFISENGNKAYFEVNYFKQELNVITYVVFAEFIEGKWMFKSKMISIS